MRRKPDELQLVEVKNAERKLREAMKLLESAQKYYGEYPKSLTNALKKTRLAVLDTQEAVADLTPY